MQRRHFIRLVGGGALATSLTGCSTGLPAEAVAAWDEAHPEGPAATRDQTRRAIELVYFAPPG